MLLLVRHGETELNWAGRLQGHMDSPLTEHGKHQANSVGVKLKALITAGDPVTLWTSPLGRAQETAAIIASHIMPVRMQTDDRLAEIALGEWEGMTMEDIEFTHPGALDGTGRFDWAYRAPGGEPEEDFLSRLKSWLDDINPDSGQLIAVSHGWAGMGLRSLYLGCSFEEVSAKGDSHEAVFAFARGSIEEH